MTIYGERTRRHLHHDGKGLVGRKVILCDWTDVEPAPIAQLPHVGDSWSPELPLLTCVSVDADEGAIGECEYTANYSTDRLLGNDFYESSWDWDLEVGDRTKGYLWRDAGTPVEEDIPTVDPAGSLRLTFKRDAPPNDIIEANLGKVNDRKFQGCAEGTLRFDGCGTDETYDSGGTLLSVRTVYKFTKAKRPHNEAWRRPLQARDENFDLIFWQNTNAAKPYYTTDPLLVSTPIYVMDTPGTAAWDEPLDPTTMQPRYEECDFATVLDIPIKAGDDAPGEGS